MLGSFAPRSLARSILHIDGDAFFASCEQSRDPALQGKPVITGRERGIASSMSYEAKARGVTRGMSISEIKQICPDAVYLPSDYETYSLLSKRFFDIVRRFTPEVEEYSIDECFADLTGLRRQHRAGYRDIAKRVQHTLVRELGVTFSIGLAPNKVLAKAGSKHSKPHGLTIIGRRQIPEYLRDLPAEKVWGIGPQTTALLAKHGMHTALQFAEIPEAWVDEHLAKPGRQLWLELNGVSVMSLDTVGRTGYASIQKFKTFSPPSQDATWVFAQLSKNIEGACIKARRYRLGARGAVFILRSQAFHHRAIEVWFDSPTSFAHRIVEVLRAHWSQLWRADTYRATGVTLLELTDDGRDQPDLFGGWQLTDRLTRVYEGIDVLQKKYGKYAVFLGSSFQAQTQAQHAGGRGGGSERTKRLLKGETKRRRVAVPMLTGVKV